MSRPQAAAAPMAVLTVTGDPTPEQLAEIVEIIGRQARAADRANLLDRVHRVHYPPQIGTHYEQGFADCLRAVLAEFERP